MAVEINDADWGKLFDLAEQSATWSFNNAQDMSDFFKDIYKNQTGPLNDLLIDKAMGEIDKMIADSDRYRQQQIDIYDPLKEQYAAAAQDYNTPERQEMEAGKAEADVAAQFEQARDTAQKRLESYGVDPSQVRSQALDLGTRVAEAAAQASAGNQARHRTEMTGYDMIANAVNQGANLPGQIIGSAQTGGQFGNQAANTSLAGVTSAGQTIGTGPTWQQIGNQGLNTWGNLQIGKTNAELEAERLDQSSSSGWGSALGAIGGILTAFLEDGGVIPDDGRPVPVEASPSAGAIPDDIPAEIEGGQPARLNAGEFVMPKDVTQWLGEKGMQQIILKARKEMGDPGQAPAQPSTTPPPGAMPSFDGAGAIPA